MRYSRTAEILSGFSLVLAITSSLWLVLWPYFYSYRSVSVASGASTPEVVQGAASLIEVNGATAFVPLAAPVVLAALAFASVQARHRVQVILRRLALWTAGVLLLGFCVLAGFSIGAFYVPAAVLSLAAAVVGSVSRRPEDKMT